MRNNKEKEEEGMIKAQDAIATARSLLGTPYSTLDCINLIKRVIRASPGGVKGYTTAGTNTLWKSATASSKYRDLTWTQEGITGARAGMLAFKRKGTDVHHVGLVTERGTVIHSSSAAGKVVETALDKSWQLLGIHRYIGVASDSQAYGAQPPAEDGRADENETTEITIIDSAGNRFNPVGDWRVIVGSVD